MQCSGHNDGGTVLVVVEDGNVAALLQPTFDLKAPRGGDVLQVDPAEGTGQQGHGVDDLIHVVTADTQGDGVHPAESLEQHALALHDRHARLGTDVAQAQHSGAVGDNRHGVPPPGKLIALVDVLLDLQAGLGHPGGVCQREGLLVLDLHLGHDVQLAPPLVMQLQGFGSVIHTFFSFLSKGWRLCSFVAPFWGMARVCPRAAPLLIH